tara:strand:+ start:14088 stop:14972 length:885 start_codon:yes stop_codon:yes gene_type:complete
MKIRYALLLLLPLFYACADSNDGVSDLQAQASALAETLSAPHTPANEAFLVSLLRNELGSEPFYLIEYRELRDDEDDTRALLASYERVLSEQLRLVGAYTAFDNVVLQQITNPEGRAWHQVRGIYFPSPQALLDVLQAPAYQQALEGEHAATRQLHAFWLTPEVLRQPVDLQPDKDEFYMANLNQHREQALYPDGTSRGLTGAEADALYTDTMLAEVLPGIGAYPVLGGTYTHLILGSDAAWDTFALVRYPSLPEFLGMVTSPRFQELVVNKGAGLARSSAMRTAAVKALSLAP